MCEGRDNSVTDRVFELKFKCRFCYRIENVVMGADLRGTPREGRIHEESAEDDKQNVTVRRTGGLIEEELVDRNIITEPHESENLRTENVVVVFSVGSRLSWESDFECGKITRNWDCWVILGSNILRVSSDKGLAI